MTDYRARSMWLDGVPGELTPRPSLPGPVDVDVAVVGAGFTGLWTAYYLKKADPTLRVAVLEKEIAGFGASGRNGGWCHTTFPGSRERAAKTHGRQAVIDQQRALHATVREIARVVAVEHIDARLHIGGQLDLATTPVQLLRAREAVEYERSWGFGEDDYVLLGAAEMRARLKVVGCLGGGFTPHAAAVDPARLARGLAEAVERLGVPIYERTPVTSLAPRRAETPCGAVSAEVVVRATEAFTPLLRDLLRTLFPQIGDVRVTHAWGGAIAASRDWNCTVGLEKDTGMAWAGAYVGDGVATTNLAGRTLRDLILGRDTELTRLPWVGHRAKRWEPEPWRWIGVNAALAAMGSADAVEARTGRPSKRATYVKSLIGACACGRRLGVG